MWDFNAGDIDALAEPVMTESRVMQGTMEGYLYSFNLEGDHDASTGKPHWIYKFGQRVEESTLCIYRDKVYVLAGDGYVHALK